MKFLLPLLVTALSATASIIRPIARDERGGLTPLEGITNLKRELGLPRTNAERLARGLPLKTPRRRSSAYRRTGDPVEPAPSPKPPTSVEPSPVNPSSPALQPSASVEPSSVAPSSSPVPEPSATPTTYTAILQIREGDDGDAIGYLSKVVQGARYILTEDINLALTIKFTSTLNGALFDINTLNGYSSIPLLGAAFDGSGTKGDLGPNSADNCVLTGVTQTPRDSPPIKQHSIMSVMGPQRFVESAIWSYNPLTSQVVPQWVNSDLSKPNVVVMLDPASSGLHLVGDEARFHLTKPATRRVSLYLQVVPLPTTPTPI